MLIFIIFLHQGVEAERSPGFTNALKNGKPVYTATMATIADGLAVPTVGVNAFATGGMNKNDENKTENFSVLDASQKSFQIIYLSQSILRIM